MKKPLILSLFIIFVVATAVLTSKFTGKTKPWQNYTDQTNQNQTATLAEMVKPAERDPAQWAGAKCNDGTPFGFQVQLSPSDSKDWVIYLKGGGFCDDNSFDCAERKATDNSNATPLTTTSSIKDGEKGKFIKAEGIFNRKQSENPTFYTANMVFAVYCSSDAWSGATTDRRPTGADPRGWYFSGRTNVKSMIEILKQNYGLDDTNNKTKVLFAGGSGGGHGVTNNADQVASLLPKTAAAGRLKILNDAGTQIDFDDSSFRPGDSTQPIRDVWAKAFRFWGSKANALCEADQTKKGLDPSYCSFGPLNYLYVQRAEPQGLGLPILLQMSSIDAAFLEWHHLSKLTPQTKPAIEAFRAKTLDTFNDADWFFSGGDYPYHTILEKDGTDKGWDIGPTDKTFKDIVTRFWEDRSPQRVIF